MLVKPAQPPIKPAEVGPVDLVIVAVKLWSTEDALRDAQPLVGPNSAVVSFQNGVVATDLIAQAFGKERTLGGVANIAAVIESPGVDPPHRHHGGALVGELDGKIVGTLPGVRRRLHQGGHPSARQRRDREDDLGKIRVPGRGEQHDHADAPAARARCAKIPTRAR